MKILGDSRPQWSSNFVYILAAIGCAAGLGNLWRFPMLAYEHGGGAFVFAILICNIVLVFPLVMMETVVGQKFKLAGAQAFEKIKKGTSWILWLPVFALFFILMFYVPILAWGIKYLGLSISGNFLVDPTNFFTEKVIHLSPGISTTGNFQWGLFSAVVASCAFVLFALRKNVLSLSPIVKITATAPFFLLLILLIRGVTLPGASDGLSAFFLPHWESLLDVKLWQAALGQSFFSASLALGYFMIAGSHRGEKDEIAKSSLWILVGNFIVSLLAGITVFATIGFMALQKGIPISEAATGGPMLVFSVLPTAVSMMPTGAIIFAVLLFLVVITLAIDSIFGIFEIIVGSFHDFWKKTNYFRTACWIAVIIAIGSLPFLTGAGMYFLDITDHFVTGYGVLFVGMLETFVLAYLVGAEKVRGWINHTATNLKIGKWFNCVLYAAPVFIAFLISVTLREEVSQIYGGYPIEYVVGFGFLPLVLIFVFAIIFGIFTHRKFKKHGLHLPSLKK
ncbi:sodium-dependent transporter [bacterium]|nr:sodium-dependent transporter [bacterium]MBT6832208.1 sodium-dependent transporter [bacterium]MBT6996153.1 sodium-dependent transporter [bacterium]MBT7772233.1 sodium-dependent transporter [bacterium]